MEQAVLPQILCPPVKFLMVEPHQRPGGVVLQVHLLLRPAQIQTERPPARPPLPNGDQIPEALLRQRPVQLLLGVSGANQRPVRVPPPAFQRLKGALHIVSHFLFRHAPSPHIQAPRLLPGAFCGPFPQERPGISSVKRPSLPALYSSNRILAIRSVSTSPPEIRKPRFFPTASSRR